MTDGQELACRQIREIAFRSEGALEVVEFRNWNNTELLAADISVRCSPYARKDSGLPLRERERLTILIPPGFPYDRPQAYAPHARFAGFPHVFWRRWLCLYQAPDTEWDYSDGMSGFFRRLDRWFRDGAAGNLNPTGAALHPPAAFSRGSGEKPLVVIRANAPTKEEKWVGLAQIEEIENRYEICGWSKLGTSVSSTIAGASILLGEEMPYDYPSSVAGLLNALMERGAGEDFFKAIIEAVRDSNKGEPLFVVLGTPMRGVEGESRRQHLTVWKIGPEGQDPLHDLAYARKGQFDRFEDASDRFLEWAENADIQWCDVQEERSEIVTRRDKSTPMEWFQGKRVAVWGCGALGGHMAISIARAGAEGVVLRDKKKVTPGILVRQPYEDPQIGKSKVEALARIIDHALPSVYVEAHPSDVIQAPLSEDDWADEADLIIDATTSQSVRGKIEEARMRTDHYPPIASVAIDQDAERGIALISGSSHSGGVVDVARRAKIEVLRGTGLEAYERAFYSESEQDLFQPEPGCSDPTFVGADSDSKSLSGSLLNIVARDLTELETSESEQSGSGNASTARTHLFTQPHVALEAEEERAVAFDFRPDLTLQDEKNGYEVRIRPEAWDDIEEHIAENNDVRGEEIETGGVLFGEINEALDLVWITDVIGPPPDSEFSETEFICGTEGVEEVNQERQNLSQGTIAFVGMWHTHTHSAPTPSPRDEEGVRRLFRFTSPTPAQSLLLIVGHSATDPEPAAHLYRKPEDVDFRSDTAN